MNGTRQLWAAAVPPSLQVFAGCAAVAIPPVDAALNATALACGLPLDRVERGHRLLTTSCAMCHLPPHPCAVTLAQWGEVLPRMLHKARLTPQNGDDIRTFVLAVRASTADPR